MADSRIVQCRMFIGRDHATEKEEGKAQGTGFARNRKPEADQVNVPPNIPEVFEEPAENRCSSAG